MTVLLAFVALAQNLAAPAAPVLAPVSTGVAATDEAAWESGLAEAQATGQPFRPRRGGLPFRITRPLVLQPAGTFPVLTVDVAGENGSGAVPLVEYSGPPGSTFLTVRGLKSSRWQDVKVRLLTQGTTGIRLSTYGIWQSTSNNTFDRIRVETYADGCVGWDVGPDGAGGSDLSCNVWRQCTVGGDSGRRSGAAGWRVHGGNTLANSWYDCGGVYLAGYAWELWGGAQWSPPHGGGDGSTFVNPVSSYCQGTLKMQGGFMSTVVGGRSEWMSGAVFWAGAGTDKGKLLVLNHRTGPECKTISRADGATPVVLQ